MPIFQGQLRYAAQRPSNFFNERPTGETIRLLVIHNISLPAGDFSGSCIEELFCGKLKIDQHPSFSQLKGLEVSAHLLIRRNAQVIQFVNFEKRAWHAGESSFAGASNCNDFSIGIELEGSDFVPFTPRQYRKLIQVTRDIQRQYPAITLNNISGHSDIAPTRKTDPGPHFDWPKYKQGIIDY